MQNFFIGAVSHAIGIGVALYIFYLLGGCQ